MTGGTRNIVPGCDSEGKRFFVNVQGVPRRHPEESWDRFLRARDPREDWRIRTWMDGY